MQQTIIIFKSYYTFVSSSKELNWTLAWYILLGLKEKHTYVYFTPY